MKTTCLILFAMFIPLGTAFAQASSSNDHSVGLRIRGKVGYTLTSDHGNFGPYGLDEMSAGLDLDFAVTDRLSLGLSANRVFLASSSYIHLFGIVPSFTAFEEGPVRIYLGAFAGVMSIYEEYFSAVDFNEHAISDTRFALGPVGGVDVTLIGCLFAHLSAQYVYAFGPQNDFGSFSAMGGLGVAF